MADRIDEEADGFTFQWKIKNISHCWWKGEFIYSPVFIVDGLQDTKWKLWFYPMGATDTQSIDLHLCREKDCSGPHIVEVKYQLALLDRNGSLFGKKTESDSFEKGDYWGYASFGAREKIFITDRESLLPEDTLTVQCIIWNKEKNPIKSKYLYAETIFKAKPRSLVWRIDKFSSRKFASRNKFKDRLIDLDLVMNGGMDLKKEVIIKINSLDNDMRYFSLKIHIIDSQGKKENCGMIEYFVHDGKNKVSFELNFPRKLMEDKSLYLPNDVLCLYCEFVFSTVKTQYESLCGGISTELQNEVADNNKKVGKDKSQNATVLTDDLKSMYSDGIFSDIELRTSTQSFPAHKAILSARSPVFRRMFSNDMKEKNSGHVDITDLEDDTVHRMLLYIYTDILEDLQFESASKLYAVADKYDIFSLKSKCSSFLKENLCPTKACDVLILADQHQDDGLKSAVQDFILDHEEVFTSQEWMYFMDSNLRLAADVMYKKINPGKTRPCSM